MVIIELPWPDPILNPNRKAHYHAKAKAAKNARLNAFLLCPSTCTPKEGKKATSVCFYPPDARKRDLDNLLSSMKSAFDGICDKLGINDVDLRPITIDMGEKVKGGKVIVRIEL